MSQETTEPRRPLDQTAAKRTLAILANSAQQMSSFGSDLILLNDYINTLSHDNRLLLEGLTWAVKFIQCNVGTHIARQHDDMSRCLALLQGREVISGEMHKLAGRAELAEEEKKRTQAELLQVRNELQVAVGRAEKAETILAAEKFRFRALQAQLRELIPPDPNDDLVRVEPADAQVKTRKCPVWLPNPKPDPHGHHMYTYPDGYTIERSHRLSQIDKWYLSNGTLCLEEDMDPADPLHPRYYESAVRAAMRLTELGHGPGKHPVPPDRTIFAYVDVPDETPVVATEPAPAGRTCEIWLPELKLSAYGAKCYTYPDSYRIHPSQRASCENKWFLTKSPGRWRDAEQYHDYAENPRYYDSPLDAAIRLARLKRGPYSCPRPEVQPVLTKIHIPDEKETT